MTIEHIATEDLAKIIAGLAQQGLTFRAYAKGDFWIIELTGGY